MNDLQSWFRCRTALMAVVAGLLLALTYLGGLEIQVTLHLSDQTSQVFQGLLMFFVLACDTFVFYRIRIVRPVRPVKVEAAHAGA